MTVATLQMTFDALPKKGQKELRALIEYIQYKYSAKKHKFPKNPKNPSPSGDPWFDDPRNLAMLEERMKDNSSVSEEDSPVIQELFAKYGSKIKRK